MDRRGFVNIDLLQFCRDWLRAWTGNNPDGLLALYHPEVYYSDPANRDGITGKENLGKYLGALLNRNPEWVWRAEELFDVRNGFVVKWHATIPVGEEVVEEKGMDLVILKDGLIIRNEVYFGTAALSRATGRT